MQQFVLKEQIKDAIAGRKILAALFYTFNFDPEFFENYVMPLLVPEKDFREEMIYNKILWRQCLKEDIIPPITVYCDFYAKDNTKGPSLGYDIFCLRLPSAKGFVSSFHAKHIFLLLEDEGEPCLLMITGSGNLTVGGWCENLEVFSTQEIRKDNSSPRTVKENRLQKIITDVAKMRPGKGQLSEAEDMIWSFLLYSDFDKGSYFNSLEQSFGDFLEEQVFSKDEIQSAELISPFFSTDLDLLEHLKTKTPVLKALIPAGRKNEIRLDEKVFHNLQQNGLTWCTWEEDKEDARNLHAKMYIFKGNKRTYTVVGSVNFTNPAWNLFAERNNQGNIEAAWLYAEKEAPALLQPVKDFSHYQFVDTRNLDEPSGGIFSRDMPEIDFILSWEEGLLEAHVRSPTAGYRFDNILKGVPVEKGSNRHQLSALDIKILAKNTLVTIRRVTEEGEEKVFTYYVQQKDYASRPLDFKMDMAKILQQWSLLGDDFEVDRHRRTIAELVTDESGMIDSDKVGKLTLLNEMAMHFNALIKLQRYIFEKPKKELLRIIRYYLLSESIDTLPYYLRDLDGEREKNHLSNAFCWMIYRIVIVDIYEHALTAIKNQGAEEQALIRKEIKQKRNLLEKKAEKLSESILMSEKEKHWILKQLSIQ